MSTCSFSCSPGQPTSTWRWTSPGPSFGRMFEDAGGSGKPRIGQIAVSYDPDEPIAIKRAMEQFRWFTGGWRVNAELPVPASFEVASRTVREEDMAAQMPCCPDLERHLAGIRQFLALVQVGGGQPRAVHHLGGNPAAASPPSVLTRPKE